MAFSTVYNFPNFTSLPQKTGSLMIKKLFSGDETLMNKILNQFKDKIAIDMDAISLKYADPFFLEWDIPAATIPYFKLKGQQYYTF